MIQMEQIHRMEFVPAVAIIPIAQHFAETVQVMTDAAMIQMEQDLAVVIHSSIARVAIRIAQAIVILVIIVMTVVAADGVVEVVIITMVRAHLPTIHTIMATAAVSQ